MSIVSAYIIPHASMVVPEIGRGKEKGCQSTYDACMEAGKRIAADAPEVIVLITPHSATPLDDVHISLGAGVKTNLQAFGASEDVPFELSYDTELAAAIEKNAVAMGAFAGSPGETAPDLDHGTMVPLYFVNKFYRDYRVVRISVTYGFSREGRVKIGKAIAAAIAGLNRKATIIASADLSHRLKDDPPYFFLEEGPQFDKMITDLMRKSDFLGMLAMDPEFSAKAANCGQRTIFVLAGAVEELELEADFLSYEGGYGFGFATCCFKVVGSAPGRDYLLELAKLEAAQAN